MTIRLNELDIPSSFFPSPGSNWSVDGDAGSLFKVYPALDHLLFAGTGQSTPTEYTAPGQHVAAELVADLAAWITAH